MSFSSPLTSKQLIVVLCTALIETEGFDKHVALWSTTEIKNIYRDYTYPFHKAEISGDIRQGVFREVNLGHAHLCSGNSVLYIDFQVK